MLDQSTDQATPTRVYDDPRGQICPDCRLPAERAVERNQNRIAMIVLLCPSEHMWQVQWLPPELAELGRE